MYSFVTQLLPKEPDFFLSGKEPYKNGQNFLFLRGIFYFFSVLYSTLLHLPPLRFHSVGGCQDICDFGIACMSDVLTTRLDLIQNWYIQTTDTSAVYLASAISQFFFLFDVRIVCEEAHWLKAKRCVWRWVTTRSSSFLLLPFIYVCASLYALCNPVRPWVILSCPILSWSVTALKGTASRE